MAYQNYHVTIKALTSGVAILTADSPITDITPGDPILVSGVGTPFEGNWVLIGAQGNNVVYWIGTPTTIDPQPADGHVINARAS